MHVSLRRGIAVASLHHADQSLGKAASKKNITASVFCVTVLPKSPKINTVVCSRLVPDIV